jgi:hypothetical protein
MLKSASQETKEAFMVLAFLIEIPFKIQRQEGKG